MRFSFIKTKMVSSNGKTFYFVIVLDNDYDVLSTCYVSKNTFDKINELSQSKDFNINSFITFRYDVKSTCYRISIKDINK